MSTNKFKVGDIVREINPIRRTGIIHRIGIITHMFTHDVGGGYKVSLSAYGGEYHCQLYDYELEMMWMDDE